MFNSDNVAVSKNKYVIIQTGRGIEIYNTKKQIFHKKIEI